MPVTQLFQRYLRLIEIARDLASTLDIDSLLARIVAVATELSKAEAASILLYDETSQQLYFKTATNIDQNASMRGMSVPVEGSLAGWVIKHRLPVNVHDVSKDQRHFEGIDQAIQFFTSSLVGIPLISKNNVIGVLEVVNKLEGDFTTEDIEVLTALGAQAAIAIENTRLFQQSDLIAELVHELRTPLASLAAVAFLMQRPEMGTAQRTELAHTLYAETQRLNELTSAFLDLARLESGRASYNMELFNIQPLLEEVVEIMSSKAQENRISLSISLMSDRCPIQADRDKLKQVLLNLISNGIKYNHSGGSITLSASKEEKMIAIAVSDTGIGIPPEALPYLFQKFYLVKCVEAVASGSGLGLLICKRVIESHHGYIEVASQKNQGSTFTVHLPLH
jgi:signal transduction histidine kinase